MSSAHAKSNSDQSDRTTDKKKSRKRTRNIEQHKIIQQKRKVQHGLEHTTKPGKIVKAKEFCEQISCNCKRNCANKIDIGRQKALFTTFYTLENWSKKRLFLRSLIKIRPAKENFDPVTIKRRTSFEYFLTNSCGNQEEVCSNFFSNCFRVSKDILQRAMKTIISNEGAIDSRGRNLNKKSRQSDVIFVKKIIKKFPCYHSHYGPS